MQTSELTPRLFAGDYAARGADQEAVKKGGSRRVGSEEAMELSWVSSGRVGRCSTLTGRVGSGHPACSGPTREVKRSGP